MAEIDEQAISKAFEDYWEGTGWKDEYPPPEYIEVLQGMGEIDSVLKEYPLFAEYLDGKMLVVKDGAVCAVIPNETADEW